MAGLVCDETSPLAWRFLQPSVGFFQAVADDATVQAMRLLAWGNEHDIPMVSGGSGVAGLAGLIDLAASLALCRQTGLAADARILLVNTEGATAPSLYETLVGQSSDHVLARQKRWLEMTV